MIFNLAKCYWPNFLVSLYFVVEKNDVLHFWFPVIDKHDQDICIMHHEDYFLFSWSCKFQCRLTNFGVCVPRTIDEFVSTIFQVEWQHLNQLLLFLLFEKNIFRENGTLFSPYHQHLGVSYICRLFEVTLPFCGCYFISVIFSCQVKTYWIYQSFYIGKKILIWLSFHIKEITPRFFSFSKATSLVNNAFGFR